MNNIEKLYKKYLFEDEFDWSTMTDEDHIDNIVESLEEIKELIDDELKKLKKKNFNKLTERLSKLMIYIREIDSKKIKPSILKHSRFGKN